MIGGFIGHGVGDVFGNAVVTYTLTGAVGSFSETGNAAVFDVTLTSAAGSFAETGNSALFDINLVSGGGSFSETGIAALFDISLASGGGSFSETGNAAPFDVSLLSNAGAYSVIGNSTSYTLTIDATVSNFTVGLPVNCVLIENIQMRDWESIFDEGSGKAGEAVIIADGGGGRLSKEAPSFTVKTRTGFN